MSFFILALPNNETEINIFLLLYKVDVQNNILHTLHEASYVSKK